MSLQRPLHPSVGVEIEGREALELDDEGARELRVAAAEHGLVVLRGQSLDPDSLVRVALVFGEPERFPPSISLAERPEVCPARNEGSNPRQSARYWHADGSMQPEPPALSLFYAVEVPSRGGDTLFSNAHAAYDALPEEMKAAIEPLSAVMTNGLRRPLVWRHPLTSRLALSVDLGRTTGIEGMGREEATQLLLRLREAYVDPELVYSHPWRSGDLGIWDNVAVVHRGTKPLAPEEPRLMLRTTVRA